jgi:5-methyltetrahydrofolate--homocysteine methyltransferase
MTEFDRIAPTMLERLAQGEVLLSNSAVGTYLQANGLEPGGCPEAMNSSAPEVVLRMSEEHYSSGADMVLTNSFGGNRFMLAKYGYGDRVIELNQLAARHARSKAPWGRFVVGSMGPTGEFLEPLGEVSEAAMYDAFGEQAKSLADGGADVILLETMTAIEEASIGVKAAKEVTGLTVMCTMTFDPGPRGFFTMMGVTPAQAVQTLSEVGADVVGANCGNGIDNMVEIGRQMREATEGFMCIQSNAGIPQIVKGQIVYPESPEYMAGGFAKLVGLGVNVVGGCCGTTPNHIKCARKLIQNGET